MLLFDACCLFVVLLLLMLIVCFRSLSFDFCMVDCRCWCLFVDGWLYDWLLIVDCVVCWLYGWLYGWLSLLMSFCWWLIVFLLMVECLYVDCGFLLMVHGRCGLSFLLIVVDCLSCWWWWLSFLLMVDCFFFDGWLSLWIVCSSCKALQLVSAGH